MTDQLRVFISTSKTSGAVLRVIEEIMRTDGMTLVGIIFDRGRKKSNKMKKIRNWLKHGGPTYVLYRLTLLLRHRRAKQVKRPVSTADLAERYQIPLVRVESVNSDEARQQIREWQADIGVSSGNRIIKKSVFKIPRFGMVNLHHGKIPDYRGGPPGFWELYNEEACMGVTVHSVDRRVDRGVILGRREIPIDYDRDTPETLYRRAGEVDGKMVVEVLQKIQEHGIEGEPSGNGGKVYTLPAWSQVRQVEKRLGRSIDPMGYLKV